MKTCGTCEHGVSRADDLTKVDCYGGPPQAIIVPAPGGLNINFVRPPMMKTERACACHKAKLITDTFLVPDNG